ncbi:chorismate mutase [Clostridium sp. LIBA-8841]|uniref:chorismate mutase n=1 Tax=Clostridium sp. LIBA-8841 TaxID=2987530 RepID=UPI002AC3A07C|nr:chorismate mutase [Clostridium sp. LIBA-8841]MDZ5254149.1 chorismate mutase [Clostridium sp. LIBA-8841]
MSDKLAQCRDKIDAIDKELMRLFEERMNVVLDVASYKQENNMAIFHKDRENQVIEKNLKRVENKELLPYAEEMLHALMDISKEYQQHKIGMREIPLSKGNKINIGFQGEKGSFSEEALIEYFGEEYGTFSFEEFEDVFEALKFRRIDYGVLPIENSSTGSITDIYDLLNKYGFHIVGEKNLRIEHNLIGIRGAQLKDIKEIYSHLQGFEQSSEFLKSLKGCKKIPYYNTAISAKYVSECGDKSKSAIGSKRAADIYDLEVLKASINNVKENYTRFIIIGRELESNELCDKMTISFSLPNKVGSLYDKLKIFSENKVNMRKIESRPIGDGTFSYLFYIDIDGNINDESIKDILNYLRDSISDYRILGCYKRAEF